jgi:citrate lyase subunit beta/citryl-CoA lyase
MAHPRDILLGATGGGISLPVCDHYCGVESRMRKSLALQLADIERWGTCRFDVTLDCEDGAPVGAEAGHAQKVAEIALQAWRDSRGAARVAVRVHAVDHPAFASDLSIVLGQAGAALCHVMVPKVESVADVDRAVQLADAACARGGWPGLPLHVLIESPQAVHQAFAIAAHPRVQSIGFGLMDFVSAHGGAIPASAMTVQGQFMHPLVLRAKLDIAAACHAYGKVPSHCVVTELADTAVIEQAARRASGELGYTRMWSIHPQQIDPIVAAFAPQDSELQAAAAIVQAAAQANWAPIAHEGRLHDRASYRYYWQVLERAHRTGLSLPSGLRDFFPGTAAMTTTS